LFTLRHVTKRSPHKKFFFKKQAFYIYTRISVGCTRSVDLTSHGNAHRLISGYLVNEWWHKPNI